MNIKAIHATDAEILKVLGIPHAVLIETHESPSGIELLEVSGAPGMHVPLHVHKNEDEAFYVAEGEVVFKKGDGEVRGFAGTCVNLPRGIPHGYKIAAPNSRMLLTVSPGNMIPMFRELADLPPGEPDLEVVSKIIRGYDVDFV